MQQTLSDVISQRPELLLGPVATIIGTLIAGIIAITALRISAAVNLRNKRVDVISRCNERYDALAQVKTEIIKSISISSAAKPRSASPGRVAIAIGHEIELFHRRFWGLKSDQIDYWLAGYVDPETLISWFMSTADTIHNPVEVWRDFSDNSDGGWHSVKAFHETTNPRLFQIVEALRQPSVGRMHPDDQYAVLFKLFGSIEREERPLVAMLTRNNHRRLTMKRFRTKLPPKIAIRVSAREFSADRARLRRTRIAARNLHCDTGEALGEESSS